MTAKPWLCRRCGVDLSRSDIIAAPTRPELPCCWDCLRTGDEIYSAVDGDWVRRVEGGVIEANDWRAEVHDLADRRQSKVRRDDGGDGEG